ncbi:MAG: hypothetical protein JWO82_875 [Akkermansiaceae bacterium]|nr:hypothetical protein [Akkermansiaceae bacterium]
MTANLALTLNLVLAGMSLVALYWVHVRHRLQKVITRSNSLRAAARGMSVEEITAIVGHEAKRVLGIKEEEWGRSMTGELRVLPGHLHDFFEDLDARHGLWIPEEERCGLSSVADTIALLTGRAAGLAWISAGSRPGHPGGSGFRSARGRNRRSPAALR